MTKLNLTEELVSLKIDLKELFGRSVPDEDLRQIIADDLISVIVERTTSGYGVENGKSVKFKKYSKAYAKKTGKKQVNLDESGGMLNSIHLIDSTSRSIEIGIDDDHAPQAHGHMTGQYGQGPLPRRSFLGLTDQDLKKIKSKYRREVQSLSTQTAKDFLNQGPDEILGITSDDIRDALKALNRRGFF